jgi:signal transduction histidine kinase
VSTAVETSDLIHVSRGWKAAPEPVSSAVSETSPPQPGRWRQGTMALRTVASNPHSQTTGPAQLAVCLALVIPAWVALGLATMLVPSSHLQTAGSQASTTILSTLAGQLAVGAAVLSIMRAWAAREIAPALVGGGFLAYGIHQLVQVSTAGSSEAQPGSQVLGSACLVLAFGLVLLSVVPRREDARRHLTITVSLAALVIALLAWAIIRPAGIGALTDAGSVGLAGDLIITAAWSALGIAAIYIGRSERVPLKSWIGCTALCLAQAHLAFVVIHSNSLSVLASGVFQTIAIALILFGTVQALQATIASNHGLIRESMLAFEGSEAQRRHEAHAHEEAVHNLRSALTSITTASHLLVSEGKVPLSEDQRSQLAAALQSELERARRLLSREWDCGRRSFSLLDVLTPVVVNEQSQGTAVAIEVPAATAVLGNPERTYEVFATLLDNARRHARGTTVTIRATATDEWVTVTVEDRGPGLPPIFTDCIFERGWTTSPRREGMGLGLYVARRLMEEQGGQLSATNRPGGGARFVIDFPAAETSGQESHPAIGFDARDHRTVARAV